MDGRMVVGITVVGEDRQGIVATFTNFVFAKGGNIEEISQNVIQGTFGMYVEASFPEMDTASFDAELGRAGREGGGWTSTSTMPPRPRRGSPSS